MKIKHLMITGCLFTAFTLHSCIKEKDLYQEPPITYSELNLKLDGDYFSTELPIARAAKPTTIDENKTIVGIAISMTPKNVANSSSKPYAYGIFELEKAKNPDNLKIRVIDGYTYRISCSMIANAKDSILAEGNSFAAPFDLERSGTIKGECLNKFLTAEQVGGAKFLHNLENPKITTKNGSQNECTRPFIERYHGLLDQLEVKDGIQNPITLYRRFFGVKFKQTGLKSGRIRINIDGAPCIYLNSNEDIHKTVESDLRMVSMRNITANIPDANKNQYLTESVKVEAFWEEAPGVKETPIANSNITFKRNYIHSIALTNIDLIGTPANIGIEVETGEMGEDPELDIPWQESTINQKTK